MAYLEKNKLSIQLKELSRIFAQIIAMDEGQPPLWPFSAFESYFYLQKYFIPELYNTIDDLKKTGVKKEEIAKLFKAPHRIAQFLLIIFTPKFIAKLTIKQRAELVEALLDYISCFRKENPFCEGQRNIIWTKEEITNALNISSFIELKECREHREFREILGKINALGFQHNELIHLAFHPNGHEIHGPYNLSNGSLLLVRDYYDIKPEIVWPPTSELPFNRIISLEIYEDIEIGIDFFGHVFSSAPFPTKLKSFSLNIDAIGNSIKTISQLKEIQEILSNVMGKEIEFISKFTKKDWVQKLIEMNFYYLKPHKDLLKQRWQPNIDVVDINLNVDQEFLDSFFQVGAKIVTSTLEEAAKILANRSICGLSIEQLLQNKER